MRIAICCFLLALAPSIGRAITKIITLDPVKDAAWVKVTNTAHGPEVTGRSLAISIDPAAIDAKSEPRVYLEITRGKSFLVSCYLAPSLGTPPYQEKSPKRGYLLTVSKDHLKDVVVTITFESPSRVYVLNLGQWAPPDRD